METRKQMKNKRNIMKWDNKTYSVMEEQTGGPLLLFLQKER